MHFYTSMMSHHIIYTSMTSHILYHFKCHRKSL